jgi:hypothetical protein
MLLLPNDSKVQYCISGSLVYLSGFKKDNFTQTLELLKKVKTADFKIIDMAQGRK